MTRRHDDDTLLLGTDDPEIVVWVFMDHLLLPLLIWSAFAAAAIIAVLSVRLVRRRHGKTESRPLTG